MAIMRPLRYALRGIFFEGSSFDTRAFYVWVFFLPLFVPTSIVSFNLGQRLRMPCGGDRWSADMPDLVESLAAIVARDALPFLAGIESPLDIALAAEKRQEAVDPYVQQAIAYAWARVGNIARAKVELDKLNEQLDTRIAWQRTMVDRADGLKASLLENSEEAQAQLDAWEMETIRGLGLETFK